MPQKYKKIDGIIAAIIAAMVIWYSFILPHIEPRNESGYSLTVWTLLISGCVVVVSLVALIIMIVKKRYSTSVFLAVLLLTSLGIVSFV